MGRVPECGAVPVTEGATLRAASCSGSEGAADDACSFLGHASSERREAEGGGGERQRAEEGRGGVRVSNDQSAADEAWKGCWSKPRAVPVPSLCRSPLSREVAGGGSICTALHVADVG